MSDGPSDWQAFPWNELSNIPNGIYSPETLGQTENNLFAPDMASMAWNAPPKDITIDTHSSTERLVASHMQDPSPAHSLPLEIARRNIPPQQRVSLPRRRSRYVLRQSAGIEKPTALVSEQHAQASRPLPIQRWRDSPPQDEAASLSAIFGALQSHSRRASDSNGNSSDLGAFRASRGPSSTTSRESGASGSSMLSSASCGSAVSGQSNHPLTIFKSRRGLRMTHKEKERKRNSAANRIFKCTFCCHTFRHKYEWMRHEKSLHLNLEEWTCTPHGPLVVRPPTGRVHCAYCNMLDPNPDHLDSHNHYACHNDSNAPRIFRRKDHLVQHLRHVHKLDAMPLMGNWKVRSTTVASRCGFCNAQMTTWEERTDHLTVHFRAGKTMLEWKGDHEFDATVACRVTNALPPYLIGPESLAPVPFSATNPASIDHFKQISLQMGHLTPEPLALPNYGAGEHAITGPDHHLDPCSNSQDATSSQELDTVAFAEILTRHLSQFARQHMAAGVVPTDEMFQRESRRVLYGDEDDGWNTTLADNSDWLRLFRQQNASGTRHDTH